MCTSTYTSEEQKQLPEKKQLTMNPHDFTK